MNIILSKPVQARPVLNIVQFSTSLIAAANADGDTLEYHFSAADVRIDTEQDLAVLRDFLQERDCTFDLHLDTPVSYPVRITFSTDSYGVDHASIVVGSALTL